MINLNIKVNKIFRIGLAIMTLAAFSFAPVVEAQMFQNILIPLQSPDVSTRVAIEISSTQATLNATYDANGSATETWFQYGKTTLFSNTTPPIMRGVGAGSFSEVVTGLLPNTTYYFRAVAINDFAVTNGNTLSFTTPENNSGQGNTGQGSVAPEVTTNNATNIGEIQAVLNAIFDANGSSAETWFQYGKTTLFGNTTPVVVRGVGTGSFSQVVTGLLSNTTYYFRAVVINDNGVTNGNTLSFTTTDVSIIINEAPSVATRAASDIGETQAVLNATFDGKGSVTETWFQYGKTTFFNNTTTPVARGTGFGSFSQVISGLESNTVYYFRAVVINDGGITRGNTLSFTTSVEVEEQVELPTVVTDETSNIEKTKVTLNGTVNPNGNTTTGWFEYGTTVSLGATTASKSIGSSSQVITLSQTLTFLESGTIYYFRAVAQNEAGIERGLIKIFKTNSTTFTTVTIDNTDQEASLLVDLKIETLFEEIAVDDIVEYTVIYKNISGEDLEDVILKIILPQEVSFRKATTGNFAEGEDALIVDIGTLERDSQGKVSLQGEILRAAEKQDILVVTAVLIFSQESGTQHQAIAYVLHKINKGEAKNLLSAAAIFSGSNFLPQTLLGWLVLLMILAGLIILGTRLYKMQIKKGVVKSQSNKDVKVVPEEPKEVPENIPRSSFGAFNNRQ